MRFQPVKCNMMQLTDKHSNKIQASYTLEGTVLENVDNIKYLCITITNNLKWNAHVSVTRWTKQAFSCSKFLSPGVSFGQIQHLSGLNSIASGYLNFTAGLT